MSTSSVDVAVVGAGFSGLAAARAYLQATPSTNLVVLEKASSLGGTWATERLYPGLKANNLLGTLQYPDFPMNESDFPVKKGQHVPAEVVNDYLNKFAHKFGIAQRIKLNTKVSAIRYEDEKWIITVENVITGHAEDIVATKVIVATGLTCEPFIPSIPGSSDFGAPLLHFKGLPKFVDSFQPSLVSSVTVTGGAKSAWDAVYLLATRGIKVHWIIRASGNGPMWMSPPYVTPFKKWLEKLTHTRLLTWFSPCIWGAADGFGWIRGLLHGTTVGRWFVDRFWNVLKGDLISLNKFDSHTNTKKLKPWFSPFWVATSLSILNYPTDFFELIRSGAVEIHINDITHLSDHTVHLAPNPEDKDSSSPRVLHTDGLILCSGWKQLSPIKFLPEGIERELGMPYRDATKPFHTEPLVQRADTEILARFPRLKNQPMINKNYQPLSTSDDDKEKQHNTRPDHPIRLYRLIAPPTNKFGNSIAFIGFAQCISTPTLIHLQSVWATAYLTNSLRIPPPPLEEDRQWEATLWSRFGRWRYPGGFGAYRADFVFDAVPYWDSICRDLGVAYRRKQLAGGSILTEAFDPYGPDDYKDVLVEWMANRA